MCKHNTFFDVEEEEFGKVSDDDLRVQTWSGLLLELDIFNCSAITGTFNCTLILDDGNASKLDGLASIRMNALIKNQFH